MIQTYSDLIIHNLSKNLAPFPNNEEFKNWCIDREDIINFKYLYDFFKILYSQMKNYPDVYELPIDLIVNDSTSQKKRQKAYTKIRSNINLLYGLGVVGELKNNQLIIDQLQFNNWCKKNKVTSLRKMDNFLKYMGFDVVEEGMYIYIIYKLEPKMLKSMSAFAKAVHKSERENIFERCDFRIFSSQKWSYNIDEVLNSLSPDKRLILEKYTKCLEQYDQKMEIKITFLLRGFWTCNYVDIKTKKSTSGFWVENDEISLKISFDNINKILPSLKKLPIDFQKKFAEGCPCLSCHRGSCDGNGLTFNIEDKEYYLCKHPWYLYENIIPEHLDHMVYLLRERMKLLHLV